MRFWLYECRKRRGITQAQLSKAVGISMPSYCHIETGKTTPRPATAKAIAAVLGFDWTRFYEHTEVDPEVH